MLEQIFLPTHWQIQYLTHEVNEDNLVITAQALPQQADCPVCGWTARRVHSRFLRRPFDLPLGHHPVRLHIHLRRFFCDNMACPKRTFRQQLPQLVRFRQHRTSRQCDLLRNQAFALGGQAASRALQHLGILVSGDSLLRLIKNTPLPVPAIPRVLGVDDWAYRRGRSYGTILVDLETRQVVDLLPDREAQTLAEWLTDRTGVEVISRDRAGAYADGARRGAPNAIQVADRFHLMKNLTDYLKRVFERKRASLLTPVTEDESAQPTETPSTDPLLAPPSAVGEAVTIKAALDSPPCEEVASGAGVSSKKQVRWEQIRTLAQHGYSGRAIAKTLSISRHTVKRYLNSQQVPLYRRRAARPSKLDPYKAYLLQRWQSGHNRYLPLLTEIRERGYRGSMGLLARYLKELNRRYPRRVWHKRAGNANSSSVKPTRPNLPRQIVSATEAAFLMIKPPTELAEDERVAVKHLTGFDDELAEVYRLSQQFAQMLRQRQVALLGGWLSQVDASGIGELQSLARGIRQDLAAVEAGLSLEWSQGIVEGKVNKLKMLKRTMFGRAGFELLRARVLHAA